MRSVSSSVFFVQDDCSGSNQTMQFVVIMKASLLLGKTFNSGNIQFIRHLFLQPWQHEICPEMETIAQFNSN